MNAEIHLLNIGPFPASFFFIFVVSVQLLKQLKVNKFAYDWIWTVDLWCRKLPPYQLRHTTALKVIHALSFKNSDCVTISRAVISHIRGPQFEAILTNQNYEWQFQELLDFKNLSNISL